MIQHYTLKNNEKKKHFGEFMFNIMDRFAETLM